MQQPYPAYESLDLNGRSYWRPARVIAELPTAASRVEACQHATGTIMRMLGISAGRRIAFGMPVYAAFMTAPEARKHPLRALLETKGCHLPLGLCTPTDVPVPGSRVRPGPTGMA